MAKLNVDKEDSWYCIVLASYAGDKTLIKRVVWQNNKAFRNNHTM